MNRRSRQPLRLGLLPPLLLLLLAACQPSINEQDRAWMTQSELHLRSYEVPRGHEDELRSLLHSTLASATPSGAETQGPYWRVSVGPSGRLVVLAPASIHEGIEALLKDLSGLEGVPAGPATVAIDYWIVTGRPSEGAGEPRSVPEIAAALDEIRSSQGPMNFVLLERVRLVSAAARSAETSGKLARVRQQASVAYGKVVADLNIDVDMRRVGHLETRVNILPGQYMVLAQAGYKEPQPGGKAGTTPGDGDDAMLFYIVRAEIVPADA